MRGRTCLAVLAVTHGILPLVWAGKPGDAAPDITVRDCSGGRVRLSAYHEKKHAVVLAPAPGTALVPAVLADACRRLELLDTAVLVTAGGGGEERKFLDGAPAGTVLVDAGGIVRRVLAGRALTGPDLAGFVRLWQSGRTVFNATCARCHGEDGDLHTCEDVKPLVGIGRRLTEAQIRERLRIGEVNHRDLMIRGQLYTRAEVDAVVVYTAGL